MGREFHTELQRDIVARIVDLIHRERLESGDRLNESRLADRLNVSRTPVRAALDRLSALGFVTREANRGVRLRSLPPRMPTATTDDEPLMLGIARDRSLGRLSDHVSEAELMRIYGCGRDALRRVLQRLLDLGSVERRPGYGWSFVGSIRSTEDELESYRFRMVVEVAAILEPGFKLPGTWADDMRRRHEEALRQNWEAHSSFGFFEMNADFHLGIAEASGNRHFRDAIERQNRMRRLSNYHWQSGIERVGINCREHMAILDHLERGDCEIAAVLMRRHLDSASRIP